ncbi:unnamed protein product [Brassica napus]|nr:unnamed protein product [Brassica napus]
MLTTQISMLALPVDCPCTDPTDLDISSSFDGLDCPIGFPLSVPVLSWLFDARESSRKEPFPVRPPADTRRSARHVSSSSSPPTVDGFGTGTPSPAPSEPILFPVTDPFCRLPLPTLFHRPEAVHLGDLMRL